MPTAHLQQQPGELPLTEQAQVGKKSRAALASRVGLAGLGLPQCSAQLRLPLGTQPLQGLPLRGWGKDTGSLPRPLGLLFTGPRGKVVTSPPGGSAAVAQEPRGCGALCCSPPWPSVRWGDKGATQPAALPDQGMPSSAKRSLRRGQTPTACRTSVVSDGAFSTESTVMVVAISTLSCCWNRPCSVFRGRCCLG